MATEWVRVRDTKNNTEFTVSLARAGLLVARGGVELLDVPAADKFGNPLPATTAKAETKSKEQAR